MSEADWYLHEATKPLGPLCQADGTREDANGNEHYWNCAEPGTVDVDGTLMCEDHAGELGYGPKQEEYGFDPDDGMNPDRLATPEPTAEPQCPNCPMCDQPPFMVMGGGKQAFCGNAEGCPVWTWNPMESRAEFFRTAQQIEIKPATTEGEQ